MQVTVSLHHFQKHIYNPHKPVQVRLVFSEPVCQKQKHMYLGGVRSPKMVQETKRGAPFQHLPQIKLSKKGPVQGS